MTFSLSVVDIVRFVDLRGGGKEGGRRDGGAANWWAAGLCRLREGDLRAGSGRGEQNKERRGENEKRCLGSTDLRILLVHLALVIVLGVILLQKGGRILTWRRPRLACQGQLQPTVVG